MSTPQVRLLRRQPSAYEADRLIDAVARQLGRLRRRRHALLARFDVLMLEGGSPRQLLATAHELRAVTEGIRAMRRLQRREAER